MKKIALAIIISLSSFSYATYTIKIPLDPNLNIQHGNDSNSETGVWTSYDALYSSPSDIFRNCTWTPTNHLPAAPNDSSDSGVQTGSCNVDRTVTVQNREINSVSGEIRNVGNAYQESSNTDVPTNRNYVVNSGTWNTSAAYTCTGWTPATNTKEKDEEFTQTSTNCSQIRTRTVSESFDDVYNGSYSTSQDQSYTFTGLTSTRQAIGVGPWVAYAQPKYYDYTVSSLSSCNVTSKLDNGNTLTWPTETQQLTGLNKTGVDTLNCTAQITYMTQKQERNTLTGEIRNTTDAPTKGTLNNQNLYWTLAFNFVVPQFSNPYVYQGVDESTCSWSPDPSTVTAGQSFTQNGTNCTRTSSRTNTKTVTTTLADKNASASGTLSSPYFDNALNISAYTNTISQTQNKVSTDGTASRTAIGTK